MSARTGRGQQVVLMGFAEALAAVETAWSLQQAGFRVVAFYRAGRRPALRHARGVELLEVPAPERNVSRTLARLHELVRLLRPAALLPLDDAALWLCSHGGDWAAPVAAATGAAAEFALDKSLQIDAAIEAGLSVPRTRTLDGLSDTESLDLPAMIKPARALYELEGSLVRPTATAVANEAEVEPVTSAGWPPSLLVQPLLRGVGEGLFGHAGPNGVVGWSAHRRVRMVNPAGSASSACRSIAVDERLVKPSELFLQAIGWRGLFMLEFLRDSRGTAWFMELNGRTWGSMALARRRGFEYPAWTVLATLDPHYVPSPPARPPELLCRNLGLELVRLAFVARGPRSSAQTDWPGVGAALRDVLRLGHGEQYYNWDPHQPAVLLADTIGTLGQYLRKMITRRR